MTITDTKQTPSDRDAWDAHWSKIDSFTEISSGKIYRDKLVTDLVRRFYRPGDTIVDFGSGQGDLIRILEPYLADSRVIGLEMSAVGIEIARQKTPRAEFYQVDLQSQQLALPQLRNTGTLCVCAEVIEHLDHPSRFLVNVGQFLAPGGRLIITVPGGPMNAFYKSIGHRRHFTAGAMAALVEGSGLKVARIYRAGFPFFNIFRLLATMRGEKAQQDAQGKPSALVRAVFASFDFLFRFNLANAPWGWQLVVVAEKPR